MTECIFQSHVAVEPITIVASDTEIVRTARVSTLGLDSQSLDPMTEEFGFINFLMRNRHGSPFEHNHFRFRVSAPIFVWREHMRHRMFSYNEESARYKKLEPRFYIPGPFRNLVQEGRPGAYNFVLGTRAQSKQVQNSIEYASVQAYQQYEKMLECGIAREVARMVLPVNIFSTAYVTMNSRSLMHFLSLRTKDEHSTYPSFPQKEIEMVAQHYEAEFAHVMPLTYRAFCENGRVAP